MSENKIMGDLIAESQRGVDLIVEHLGMKKGEGEVTHGVIVLLLTPDGSGDRVATAMSVYGVPSALVADALLSQIREVLRPQAPDALASMNAKGEA